MSSAGPDAICTTSPNAPARAARPARPAGTRGRRARARPAGVALLQQAAAAGEPRVVARRPGCGAELLLPATGPVNVVAGTPFGTFGAWTTLATPATDTYLTRLQARRSPSSLAGFLVEFAYGAGPTALDALRDMSSLSDPSADDTGKINTDLNTFNTRIPAGQALQARITDGSAAATWEVWATGWPGAVPTFTALTVTAPAGAGRYYPSNTSLGGLSVTAAAFPNYGAWVTVTDPAPNDLLVVAVQLAFSAGNVSALGVAYQLGVGAAGAEQPVGTFICGRGKPAANCDPPVLVITGERLAIRASSNAATARAALIKVIDL